jgi:chromosome segregation protein
MILKRLSCFGFKSFADKTEFDFDAGVTCIVGPNGCGKSNVVDAIKWVLGEQSARSLRGKQMLDVIFNGSGTRKSSGFAQVDLLFENTAGTLASDQSEVLISRRLYRSGESEYLINKQPCRLKDVRELFMDTGIGRSAYSVIEQGKVDVLLHSNPTERRTIFEEAAGISKYKARKKEAVRKLDRTEQNLLRVQDILDEVQKRLRSVKIQATKAKSYKEHTDRLRELRASYSLAEYHRLSERVNRLQGEMDDANDASSKLRADIAASESKASQLDTRIVELDGEIAQLDNRLLTVQSEMTANEERIKQSAQRIEELRETRAGAQRRVAGEREQLKTLALRIDASNAGLAEIEENVAAQRHKIESQARQDQEYARELTTLHAQIEDEKAGVIDLLRKTAQFHNELTGLNERKKTLSGQKERLHARDAELRRQIEEVLSEKAAADQRSREIEHLIEAETRKLDEKKSEAARVDGARAEVVDRLATAKENRSALQSRHQLLADMDRKMEGIGAGVCDVLRLKLTADEDSPQFSSLRGMVADLIETDTDHALVIEAVLGEQDQYLVASNGDAFLSDLKSIEKLDGQVRAILVDRLGPLLNVRDLSDQPGFVANALDWIRFDPRDEQLIRHLFGKVIVVETLDHAARLSQMFLTGHRFVTLAGEVVDPNGRIVVGPPASRAGLVSRKSELRELHAKIEQVEAEIIRLTDHQNQMSAEAEHLANVQQELRTAIYEANAARIENKAALQNINEHLRRFHEEQPLISGEVESIERQMEESARLAAENEVNVTQLEFTSQERQDRIEQLESRVIELTQRRAEVSDQLTQSRVLAGQLDEKRTAAAGLLNNLRESQAGAQSAVATAQREADECEHRLEQAERTVLIAESRLAEIYAQKEEVQAQLARLREERTQARAQIEQLAATLRHNRSRLDTVEQNLHELQLKRQESDVRRDELVTRVQEELEINLAAVYASYEYEEQDWAAVETEIAELRQKIDRLGNVNVDAITEQQELEERLEFLQTQFDDLVNSKDELEKLIERLNKECRERFTKTFEQIRLHFQELFKKLFGGGKADILLEGSEDVLEAGVEVVARPPGKELRSISLLSGGEKTMTAIALVLAVFRSRPSPFAILDEVDAALDEANNERFNRIVQEFLSLSQFIVITHSKRTMAIADVMYGVTMQEAGVSKRVSVRFDSEDGAAAPAVA